MGVLDRAINQDNPQRLKINIVFFKATQIHYKLFLATGSTKYVIVFCRIIKRFCRMKKYI